MAIQEASFIVLEDGTRKKKAAELITEGQAVSLDANGELVAGAAAVKTFGISKRNANAFEDFSFGEFGAFGSGQLTVVLKGILRLEQSVFNKTEIDSSTTVASAPTTIKVFDDGVTYAVGEALYVDGAGLISNDNSSGKESLLGKVIKTPAQLSGALELELDPPVATTAADYA